MVGQKDKNIFFSSLMLVESGIDTVIDIQVHSVNFIFWQTAGPKYSDRAFEKMAPKLLE